MIDNTPLLTSKRKEFYKKYILLRKHAVIDRAYKQIAEGTCDQEALKRLSDHVQLPDRVLWSKIKNGEFDFLKQESRKNWVLYVLF